ncbi:MAG: alpha/beta fold hydrolase, partial [Firmicutes bacterium]|nr:alpha/beta fold hydrolase [Bacillota bacterium]
MWILYTLLGLAGFAALLMLAAGYVAWLISLTRREKKPSIQEPDAKAQIRIDANIAGGEYLRSLHPEDISMRSRDGLELKGWYLPAAEPSNKLAVLVHGYTNHGPGEFGGFLKFYHEVLGYNVLLPDHRAHGRSGGKRVGFAALEWQDIFDWTDIYARRLGPDAEAVLHGISMGAATVMQCNAHNPPDYIKCIVEDCGYTNGYEMMWLAARRDLHLNIP